MIFFMLKILAFFFFSYRIIFFLKKAFSQIQITEPETPSLKDDLVISLGNKMPEIPINSDPLYLVFKRLWN